VQVQELLLLVDHHNHPVFQEVDWDEHLPGVKDAQMLCESSDVPISSSNISRIEEAREHRD
jgi:hypothetical protein